MPNWVADTIAYFDTITQGEVSITGRYEAEAPSASQAEAAIRRQVRAAHPSLSDLRITSIMASEARLAPPGDAG